MILLEAGEPSDKAFDAKIVFAMTLCARGHRVAINQKTLPPELARAQRYEVAPFLCDVETIEISRILVIGAENLSGDTLLNLRSLRLGAQVPVTAIGSFSDHQTQISSRSKLAYCLGREPEVIDLRDLHQKTLIPAPMTPLLAPPPPISHRQGKPNVFIFVPDEVLEDPATLPILTALDNHAEFRLGLILSGKGHEATRAARFPGLTSYASRDVSPMALAQLADVAVFLGEAVPDERMAVFAIALMRAARVLVDCTSQRGFLAGGAPALQGPMELAGLANFLTQTVMVNRAEIGRQTGVSPWLASHGIERLEQALGLPAPDAAKLPGASGPIMFHPTNGVGLGHARRCLEIAAAMTRPAAAAFAAFPSCLPMIAAQGHACVPLVQKSPFHSEEYANDILNYIRFRQILREGSVFVFDGGFVFDSVCRIIQEKSLSGVWIRRGLWQPGQITATTLEREKVFGKVIVPDEAFERGLKYMASCRDKKGAYGYTGPAGPRVTLTAIGSLTLSLARLKTDPSFKDSLAYLKKHLNYRDSTYPFYFEYYMSQALFHADQEVWKEWNYKNMRYLGASQAPNGSWLSDHSAAYSTSAALLSLALNYRFLPIYEQ